MNGITQIAAERLRQVEREGWSADHDDSHDHGQLARCAGIYALPPEHRSLDWRGIPYGWPFDGCDWKPGDRIREPEKAGALIAAEIDRLLRSDAKAQKAMKAHGRILSPEEAEAVRRELA